jgi:enoyl-CoA hydratase/carnithine racemase
VAGILSEPGRIWRVTLSRAEARNAVTEDMLGELGAALGDAAASPDARVVLVRGAGDHFCAGADLGELNGVAGSGVAGYGGALEDVLRAIVDHPLPVIAAVQGAALGAGCQLVTACDLVVAEGDARIGIPSAQLGIVIAYESIERLVLAVGASRTADLLLAAREVSGREAAAWGLVTEAVPAGRLAARTEELAETVAAAAPMSVRASKRGIRAVLRNLSIDRQTEGYRVAEFDMMVADALASDDLREGLQARRERRAPRFGGS